MLTTVEGFFDGESVKLSEPVADKKNQRVIVTFVDDSVQASKPKESLTELFKAIVDGKYDGKKSNKIDADKFIREFHEYINSGQCEADKKAAKLGLLDDPVLTALATDKFVSTDPIDFDVDAYIRESRGYTNFGLDAVMNMRLKRPNSDADATKKSDAIDEEKDPVIEALAAGKFSSKDRTNFDVDAYIRESRGYTNFGLDAVMNMRLKRPDSNANEQTEELSVNAGA